MRARADEVRHARRAASHARRYGAVRRARSRKRGAVAMTGRNLLTIARENEVEGCVREAYGALAATYQAHHASDPRLRALFRGIARDETRHLALALELRGFLHTRLSESARRDIARARHRAVEALARDLREPVDPRVAHLAGVPPPEVALALVGELATLIGDQVSSHTGLSG